VAAGLLAALMFTWQPLSERCTDPVLTCRTIEVARLTTKVSTGEWIAILRYPNGESVWRPCSSYEAGRAGIEAWAERHREAIVADIEARFADFRRQVPGIRD
jgi:hypothetical protein